MNDTSQATLFLEKVKLLPIEARQLKVVDGIFNATSGIIDGIEAIGEYFKLKFYHSAESQPRTDGEKIKLNQKKNLSWIVIAKDVASVAGAALALTAIIFAASFTAANMALIATGGLVCSSIWLGMKLTSIFYAKMVVDASIPGAVEAH